MRIDCGKIVRAVLASVAMLLIFGVGGCKSSRSAVRGGESGASTSQRRRPVSSAEAERLRVVRASDNALVKEAAKWLGTPYRYGGSEKGRGTDCSGLTMEVYRSVLGLKIPRNSAAQQEFCAPLKREGLRAGDLVFFSSQKGRSGRVSHVGLYVDEGVFVHASSSRGVIASHLDEPYYDAHFHSGGRVGGPGMIGNEGRPDTIAPAAARADSVVVELDVQRDSVAVHHAWPVDIPTAPIDEPMKDEPRADSIRTQVKMAF